MVRDTPPSQDVSTHQIWNSYLKEYRRYGPDTKAGRTDGQCDYYMPPKVPLGALKEMKFSHLFMLISDDFRLKVANIAKRGTLVSF